MMALSKHDHRIQKPINTSWTPIEYPMARPNRALNSSSDPLAVRRSTLALLFITLLLAAGGAKGAPIFSIANPYRHFQHQEEAGGVWTENFNGICYATSAANVSMSIADKNAGITLNGFTNTSLGAESFEAAYCGVANTVTAGPAWIGDGSWVNAPWFAVPDAANLRVMDFYLGNAADWATIPMTVPTLDVVGAFARLEAVTPFRPFDMEWWSNYHVVGVHQFDFSARTMSITDSNKDRLGAEFTTVGGHAIGGAIPNGAGILDGLSWTAAGAVTNHGGANMDNEQLTSLRVLYLVPEPSTFCLTGLGLLSVCVIARRRRMEISKAGPNPLTTEG